MPGGPGAYVANASEHDDQGDTTHLPEVHVEKTHRRFNKLKLLETGTYEVENAAASVALMPWGGSKGSALAAYRLLRFTSSARDVAAGRLGTTGRFFLAVDRVESWSVALGLVAVVASISLGA